MAKKIFVCCPGNVITGGPELLHQLVDVLQRLGKEAYISYYPFNQQFDCPPPYRHYCAPQKTPEDTTECLIVLPEVATHLAKSFRRSEVAIWWLSVDNYLGKTNENVILDLLRHWRGYIRGKLPIRRMKSLHHFTQSEYARHFLAQYGIKSAFLTDYLGKQHLVPVLADRQRKNIILYNPKKGSSKTQLLLRHNPDLQFVPIRNMTSKQVRELLETAKVYIDFGNHPGKDRFPREAAMAGCCVITGRQGSANYDFDIPIPEQYKLDDNTEAYLKKFRSVVDNIYFNFDRCTLDFEKYRALIKDEQNVFEKQVGEIFI